MHRKLFYISLILLHCHGSNIYDNLNNLQFYKCRTDPLITEVKHNLSFLDCIKSCNARAACKSFVYHVQLHMCGFYGKDDESGIRECWTHPVWYGIISNYSRTKINGCESKQCADGSACVIGAGQVTCKILECPAYSSTQQVKFLGNLDEVGQERRVIDLVGRTTHLEECASFGQWLQIIGSNQPLLSLA